MIKMTRNISRVKITSDLQTKHELASNGQVWSVIKIDISRRQHLAGLYSRILYLTMSLSNQRTKFVPHDHGIFQRIL